MYRTVRQPVARLFSVLLLTALPLPAAAQFLVESTRPATGATDVPIESVIRFEFSGAVHTANDFARNVVVEPRDAVTISQVALLVRDLDRPAGPDNPPAVVEFTVRHRPATDYTWLVYAVRDADDRYLTDPAVLRYTTASTIGSQTVSGNVGGLQAKSESSAPASTRAVLRSVYERLSTVQLPPHASAPPNQSVPDGSAKRAAAPRTNDAAGTFEPHTQVLLVGEFDVRTDAWEVEAAGVVRGASGTYRIEHVRPGTYWPVAVRYSDVTHRRIEALGFFDADGDAAPDSIIVDEDRQAVHMSLYPYAPATARERLAEARAAADALGFSPAPNLQLIDSEFGARTDGTAYGWSYRFYAGRADTLITVYSDPLSASVADLERASSTQQRTVTALPPTFIDSNEALEIALQQGGADVIDRSPLERVTVTIFGGNRHWLLPAYEPTPFWDVHLVAAATTGVRTFDIKIDMTTGEIVQVGSEPHHRTSATLTLRAPYPHPVATATTIGLTVGRGSQVSVVIYDTLGRRVTTLLDEALPPGLHEVTWDAADVSAGLYVCELTDGTSRTIQPILVAH